MSTRIPARRRRRRYVLDPSLPTPEAFLAGFAPAVAGLAQELRGIVQAAIPDVIERVRPGWRSIGFRDAHAGNVCALFLYPDRVDFYFDHGAALVARGLDPAGLLIGSEAARHVRHVPLEPGAPVPVAALGRLVEAAVRYQL